MSDYQLGREIWTEVQEFRLGMTEGLANHVHGAHLESLLKVSAGQWNTLFNFSSALTAKSAFCCATGLHLMGMWLSFGRPGLRQWWVFRKAALITEKNTHKTSGLLSQMCLNVFAGFFMAPSSQRLEPPQKPGRFIP